MDPLGRPVRTTGRRPPGKETRCEVARSCSRYRSFSLRRRRCGRDDGHGRLDQGGHGTVDASKTSTLGTVLVAANGHMLYRYTVDSKGVNRCSNVPACSTYWPALLIKTGTKPTVGSGASAKLLGTISAANGMRQVTYAGFPLYFFSGDKNAGQETARDSRRSGTSSPQTGRSSNTPSKPPRRAAAPRPAAPAGVTASPAFEATRVPGSLTRPRGRR